MDAKRRRRRSWPRRRYPLLRAWAVFFFWIASFSAVAMAGGLRGVFRLLTHHVAEATALTLRLLGHPAQASGVVVDGWGFSLEIIPPCTGLLPALLFLAAVFAYPCRWREKALGVALGLPGIYLLNLARVVSLYFIGLRFPAAFERAHMLVWQPLVIFSSVALWLLWVVKLTRPAVVGER